MVFIGKQPPKNGSGFSIIEFLIAISLGALLVGTMTGIYLSNKSSADLQRGLAHIQENGRLLNYFLSKSIRMAGFQGCANKNLVTVNNLVNGEPVYEAADKLDFSKSIYGHSGMGSTWTPSVPATINQTGLQQNSDLLIVRKGSNPAVNLSANMTSSSDAISLASNNLGLSDGDTVIISDCINADIFVISSSGSSQISISPSDNSSTSLSKAYEKDAKVMKYEYLLFYVRKELSELGTGRNGEPKIELRVKHFDGAYEHSGDSIIAVGVEKMKVSYGIDSDNDGNADTYQAAAAVSAADWEKVITVNIKFLLTSFEKVTVNNDPYFFDGETITPTDNILRREWNTFIRVRNKVAQ